MDVNGRLAWQVTADAQVLAVPRGSDRHHLGVVDKPEHTVEVVDGLAIEREDDVVVRALRHRHGLFIDVNARVVEAATQRKHTKNCSPHSSVVTEYLHVGELLATRDFGPWASITRPWRAARPA